ncbi:hypothetical protein [Klebsiella pneumoniae]|uniref:hypothetical protein n=1 Tax=Klebsiella pneumoniae TaxID=573 RepID=UPI00226D943E|nr:hypothetical protein [Klebsiella pneumoniae]MCY0155226.1 hypothetical protein [Klebsiella pneumoniae]
MDLAICLADSWQAAKRTQRGISCFGLLIYILLYEFLMTHTPDLTGIQQTDMCDEAMWPQRYEASNDISFCELVSWRKGRYARFGRRK